MDNCTHTLIGVTLGNAVLNRFGSRAPARFSESDRLAVIWTSTLASNLADFDFLYSLLTGGGKLGYLMHHRGHTHTFVLVPIMAALSMWLAVKISRGKPTTRQDWFFLYGVALLAAAFHIIADLWNDYGVHPFWPFDNHWYYGDSIFIIEPLFLLAMMPLAIFTTKTLWVRYFWMTLWVLLLSLIWVGPFARWDLALVLTAWAGTFFYSQWKNRSSTLPAIAGVCATLAIFFTGSQLTKASYREFAAERLPNERIIQLLTSPAPANPLCWRIMTASIAGDDLVIRSGNTSLWPDRMNPHLCNYRVMQPGRAELLPVNLQIEPSIAWVGEFRAPLAELKRLNEQDCRFSTLMQFTRMPFWQTRGESRPAGDLRYDFQAEPGFAEIDLAASEPCPWGVPPWIPPLADALR